MSKVSINELGKVISAKHKLSQADAEVFVANLFDVINGGLSSDKIVKVKGLGTFKIIDVRERESVNVNTGERVVIEGHGKVSFTPDAVMRDLVNKPFAKFETVVLNDGVEIEELNKIDTSETEEPEEDLSEVLSSETPEPIEEFVPTAEPETKEPIEPQKADEIHTDNTFSENEEEDFGSANSIFNKPVKSQILSTNQPKEQSEEVFLESETAPKTSESKEEIVPEDNELNTNHSETEVESTMAFKHNKKHLITLGIILIIVAAFAAGYFIGQSVASRPIFKTIKVYNVTKTRPTIDTIKADSVTKTTASKSESDTPKTSNAPVKDVAPIASESNETEAKQSLSIASRQVKTGAYIITGTSTTITVKKGQTLKQLSKFYLGDGMECYIQVHNNIADVKEGMTLKIPQLKIKKR